MNVGRIVKHSLMTDGRVKRLFPYDALPRIEKAIQASETAHVGEVRFAVEGALDGASLFQGQSAGERADEGFSRLRVWDTQHNNGLLVYLLLADRAMEILADRGIHAKVGAHEWKKVCRLMEGAFTKAT